MCTRKECLPARMGAPSCLMSLFKVRSQHHIYIFFISRWRLSSPKICTVWQSTWPTGPPTTFASTVETSLQLSTLNTSSLSIRARFEMQLLRAGILLTLRPHTAAQTASATPWRTSAHTRRAITTFSAFVRFVKRAFVNDVTLPGVNCLNAKC